MTISRLLARKLVVAMMALALVAGAAGWYFIEGARSEGLALTDLDAVSFAELKNEFNHVAGEVRVIVLLSPT